MVNTYISLEALAASLGLPKPFLRKQAERGLIPCLRVGGRLRFEEPAVREALRRQATPKANEGADDGQ